jgi:hypothetical protein
VEKSLLEFINSLQSSFQSTVADYSKTVTVVVGNDAADLDSIASSVVYAYFRTIETCIL